MMHVIHGLVILAALVPATSPVNPQGIPTNPTTNLLANLPLRKLEDSSKHSRIHVSESGTKVSASRSEEDQPATMLPNIVLVFSDDHNLNSIDDFEKVSGYTEVGVALSPTIDKISSQGFAFSHAITNSLHCKPSRNTLFTSMYPHQVGLLTNNQAIVPSPPPPNKFLARELRNAGYFTAGFGKWHSSFDQNAAGFNYYDADKNGDVAGAVVSFLNSNPPEPFFVYVSLREAHVPWDPPGGLKSIFTNITHDLKQSVEAPRVNKPAILEYWDYTSHRTLENGYGYPPGDPRAVIDDYFGETFELDSMRIKPITHALSETGRHDNTLLVVSADQGVMLGEHGVYLKGPFPYQEVVRVPMIFRWPNTIPQRKSSDAPIGVVDIAPTILDLVGVPIPNAFNGQSFKDVILGQVYSGPPISVFQSAREGNEERNPSYNNGSPYRGHIRGLITEEDRVLPGRWKIILHQKGSTHEMYDLVADPYELNNLVGVPGYQSEFNTLYARLKNWMQANNDPADAYF